MTEDGRFYIDDKPCKLERGSKKVSELLRLADASVGEAVLVSEDGTEHDDLEESIEIAPGDRFETRELGDRPEPDDAPPRYAVNGEENTATENPRSLESILRNAGDGAAIDVSDLRSYYLENTVDGRKYENLDDLVTIRDGDNFLAIHVGSTPVA